MGDTRLTVQRSTVNAITPSYNSGLTATTETYMVRNNGRTYLHLKKANAVDCTVSVHTPGTVGGVPISEHTFTVPASGGDKIVGPFPPAVFNDQYQDARFIFGDIDGLTVAVVQL